jgi:hypothetical protein
LRVKAMVWAGFCAATALLSTFTYVLWRLSEDAAT